MHVPPTGSFGYLQVARAAPSQCCTHSQPLSVLANLRHGALRLDDAAAETGSPCKALRRDRSAARSPPPPPLAAAAARSWRRRWQHLHAQKPTHKLHTHTALRFCSVCIRQKLLTRFTNTLPPPPRLADDHRPRAGCRRPGSRGQHGLHADAVPLHSCQAGRCGRTRRCRRLGLRS